jgi:hypothetical protein
MRASIAAEEAGVPAVAITATGFSAMATAVSAALDHPDIPLAEFPGVIMTEDPESFRSKVSGPVFEGIVRGLTDSLTPAGGAARVEEPEPVDIVVAGSLDDIQEYFLARGWTDGLPIIPPTLERVQAFLRFTDRHSMEVIGLLLPARREATVWNVAVNGVMAGCRAEYMPILLAIAEILADPAFRLEDAGSTPGWEPLVIVSGPMAKALDFNSGSGAMRVGRQANTSIGRFVRLYMRNLAGLRIPPEATDKGSFGQSFNVALAENEDAIRELGWQPFRADRGLPGDDTVITVQSVVAISPPVYTAGKTAEEHLQTLAWFFTTSMGPWAFTSMLYQEWHPLVAISPSVATVLARNGWDKDRIRHYLYENAKLPAEQIESYAYDVGATGFDIERLVMDGQIPEFYLESRDPHRLLPLCFREDWIQVVVAGDPARNQSKVYVNNHEQGRPVSRVVKLPESWDDLRWPSN